MKFVALLTVFALSGCGLPAAVALPIAFAGIGAGAAVGALAVDAEHSCRADGGCKALPLPP